MLKQSRLTMLVAFGVMASAAQAATDGTLGASSTGTSDITLTKEGSVQISGLSDIDLGSQSALSADATGSDDVCVFSSTGSYTVTVTSSNGDFVLSDVDTATDIPYNLNWTADATAQALTYNTASVAVTGDQNDPTCGGTPNANFEVVVPTAGFNAAEPGTYVDTLTLLISPE